MNDKKLAIITPLVILVIMISFSQVFIITYWITDHKFPTTGTAAVSGSGDLLMLGYNYNKDLATLSATFWNKGSKTMSITGVSFDGSLLIMGVVGSPTDLTHTGNVVTSNDIVFPAANHWNMFTGGPTTPIIEPSSISTFYLGVGTTEPGSHTLAFAVGTTNYAFEVSQ